MSASFYFYDLETSGINPRSARIMQFAGQRTDMELRPLSEPDNLMIKLTEDILPEPDAVLVTGITPQATNVDGITEAEFLKYFENSIAQPETIFVGYNNVRFDDEFMRFSHYRNFYDAYEWSWRDHRSRWDLLDVIRMTRALRPEGIEWPFAPDGKPSNRLELLTSVNGLDHQNAHDALSDVYATIAVARLLKNKQPRLFDYLLNTRNKQAVKDLVETGKPFVYSSGKYPNSYQKTTVAVSLGAHPGKQGVLVYDLRRNPEDFVHMMPPELALAWRTYPEDETMRFPVKTLQFNRCPAVAPLSVVISDTVARDNIRLDIETINTNYEKLLGYPNFVNNLRTALKILDKKQQTELLASSTDVDAQLYDGFFNDQDRTAISVVRAAGADEIASLDIEFKDKRLTELLPLYKARNFKSRLDADQISAWEKHRYQYLLSGGESSRVNKFYKRLQELSERKNLSTNDAYLLEELKLYADSIMPDESI
jgi:exodeoxyribonuclease-1